MNVSEVARLRDQIEQECISLQLAMTGFAAVADHETIHHRYDAIGHHQNSLEKIVGVEQAALITVETYQKVMK